MIIHSVKCEIWDDVIRKSLWSYIEVHLIYYIILTSSSTVSIGRSRLLLGQASSELLPGVKQYLTYIY